MGGKAISKNKTVKKEVQNLADGTKITTTTTTTVTKYSDGSTETHTEVETETETQAPCARTAQESQPAAGSSKPAAPATSQKEQGAVPPPTNASNGKTDEKFMQEGLREHNEVRAKHGCPPLVLDQGLNAISQKWADQLAVTKKLEHSDTNYGENLYFSTKPGIDGTTAVQSWYREIDDFDYKKMKPQKGTGHFTQVIWKNTKKLGYACAYDKTGGLYVVATYDPAGNYVGEYAENVPRPK